MGPNKLYGNYELVHDEVLNSYKYKSERYTADSNVHILLVQSVFYPVAFLHNLDNN